MDAAVATVMCQGVVNPFASGAGGGFFMTIVPANSTATATDSSSSTKPGAEFINAREVAPAAADKDMYKGVI